MNKISDMFNLDGYVALVIGASRGIGYTIAQSFANAGATVFGLGRTSLMKRNITDFTYKTCDITNTKDFEELVFSIFKQKGRVDILVNAAGITLPNKMDGESSCAFKQTIECNLTAAFECCRKTIPYMLRNGYGSIVNVTSIGATLGFPGNPAYVASKGGLAALTRALAVDYGKQGVRVNNLVPGYIRTEMTEQSYVDPERRQARSKRTMLDRWGKTEELAGAAIFLASPASSYVTGTDLYVDGGWTSRGL